MSVFAKVCDPTVEDLADPYRHYTSDGEPLEDRLYLPVGFDPAKRVTEVVALHPYPGQDQIVLQRTLPTTGLTETFWLVEETQRLAAAARSVRPPEPPHRGGVGHAGPTPTGHPDAQEEERCHRRPAGGHALHNRREPCLAHPARAPGLVSLIDLDWGPAFITVCGYAPYAMKLCTARATQERPTGRTRSTTGARTARGGYQETHPRVSI